MADTTAESILFVKSQSSLEPISKAHVLESNMSNLALPHGLPVQTASDADAQASIVLQSPKVAFENISCANQLDQNNSQPEFFDSNQKCLIPTVAIKLLPTTASSIHERCPTAVSESGRDSQTGCMDKVVGSSVGVLLPSFKNTVQSSNASLAIPLSTKSNLSYASLSSTDNISPRTSPSKSVYLEGCQTSPLIEATLSKTEKIMNQETTFSAALSKAAFLDKVIYAMDDGIDEQSAFIRAAKATPLVSLSTHVDTKNLKTGLQNMSAHILDGQDNETGPKRLDLNHVPFNFKQRKQPLAQELNGQSIHPLENERSTIPTHIHDSVHAKDQAMDKLKDLIDKMNELSANMQLPLPTDFGEEPINFRSIKKTHQKIQLLINDYDVISDSVNRDQQQVLKNAYQQNTVLLVEKAQSELRSEYEKKIKHDQCNSKIMQLSKECALVKAENTKLAQTCNMQSNELKDLRVFKSSIQTEQELMLKELATRRMNQKLLLRQLKAALKRVSELEIQIQSKVKTQDDGLLQTNQRVVNESDRKPRAFSASSRVSKPGTDMFSGWDEQSTIESRPISGQSYHTKTNEKYVPNIVCVALPDHHTSEYEWTNATHNEHECMSQDQLGKQSITFQNFLTLNESTDTDDNGIDINDQAMQSWWQTLNSQKPQWNKSTTTQLLSQKCPPSVIYTANKEESEPAISIAYESDTDQVSSHNGKVSRDAMLHRIHAPCRKQRRQLQEAIFIEREKQRKSASTLISRSNAIKQIIDIMKDCIDSHSFKASEDAQLDKKNSVEAPHVDQSVFLEVLKGLQKLYTYMDTAIKSHETDANDDTKSAFRDKNVDHILTSVIYRERIARTNATNIIRTHDPGVSDREAAIHPENIVRHVVYNAEYVPPDSFDQYKSKSHTCTNHLQCSDEHEHTCTSITQKQHEFHNVKSWMQHIKKKRPYSAESSNTNTQNSGCSLSKSESEPIHVTVVQLGVDNPRSTQTPLPPKIESTDTNSKPRSKPGSARIVHKPTEKSFSLLPSIENTTPKKQRPASAPDGSSLTSKGTYKKNWKHSFEDQRIEGTNKKINVIGMALK